MKGSFAGFLVAAVALLIALGVGVYAYQNRVKVVYVDFNKLYAEFDLTKEYDKKIKEVQLKRQVILDSLSLRVSGIEAKEKPNSEILIHEKTQLFQLKEKFEVENDQLTQNLNSQIIKQINQYLMEYGKAHEYDYVLGANGNGSLMYANPKNDLTEEALKYINKRYKGL